MRKNHLLVITGLALGIMACETDDDPRPVETDNDYAVFLLIDEESIDNDTEPNNFTSSEVNDDLSEIGQRRQLRYFEANEGREITLYTGQVGDEGWYAVKTVPNTWIEAGPTDNGLRNFLAPGPGLGASGSSDDRDALLDDVPGITPLRATGLAMLEGQTVFAVVYDSDISINYSPLRGNLQGENLGVVAFDVLEVGARSDGSSSSLPYVRIRIQSAYLVRELPLHLFENAPILSSSSEPMDIQPPASPPAISLSEGN